MQESETGSYRVRLARASDRAAIASLWRELMALHSALDPRFRIAPDGEQRYARHIQEMIRSRDALALVAEASATGEIIGFAVGEVLNRPPIALAGKYGFISDVCVRQDWRRGGVGRALFLEMRRWFALRKATCIELYAAAVNPDSTAFWESMGFSPFLKLMHLDL